MLRECYRRAYERCGADGRLAASLPAGVAFTAVFLVAATTLDARETAIAAGVAMLLVPITGGLALLDVGDPRAEARERLLTLASRLPTILAGWLVTVVARVVLAVVILVTIGGTLGTLHAVVRYVGYAMGMAAEPGGPVFTPTVLAVLGVAILGSLALAALPLQFALPLLVRGERGPIGAIRASARILRRRPGPALLQWTVRTALSGLALAIYPIAVWTGAVGMAPIRAVPFWTGERYVDIETDHHPAFDTEYRVFTTAIEGGDVVLFAAAAVVLATLVHAFRAQTTRSVLAWIGEPALEDAAAPSSRASRLLAPRRLAVLGAILLVVSGAGAAVRLTDAHPTQDVTQDISDIGDPDELLAVGIENRNRTSHERIDRLEMGGTTRLWTENGTEILERNEDAAMLFAVTRYERETREAANFGAARLDPDTEAPNVVGQYLTDVSGFATEHTLSHDREQSYAPDFPPNRSHMETLWNRESSWNGTAMAMNATEFDDVPHQLTPEPRNRRNLRVLSRNETNVVLGIEEPRAARSYYIRSNEGAFPYRYAYVGDQVEPVVEAVRTNDSREEAVAFHDASFRIVLETLTGRVERLVYTERKSQVTEASQLAIDEHDLAENETHILVSTMRIRDSITFRKYGTATVDRPAGVPGLLGRPTVNSQLSRLADYLRY